MGLVMGGVSAAGSLMSGLAGSAQQSAQASANRQQAEAMRMAAKSQAEAGRTQAESIAERKSQLRRDYEQLQGRNAASLGQGNVDLSSGSAMDVALGNAENFSQDVGANAYEVALKKWETRNQVMQTNAQANQLDSMASWQERVSRNLTPSLLGAGLAGVTGFMGAYGRGGRIGSAGSTSGQFWDRALGKWVANPVRH